MFGGSAGSTFGSVIGLIGSETDFIGDTDVVTCVCVVTGVDDGIERPIGVVDGGGVGCSSVIGAEFERVI